MPVAAPDPTGSVPMPTDRPQGDNAHRTAAFGCTTPLQPAAVRAPADTMPR